MVANLYVEVSLNARRPETKRWAAASGAGLSASRDEELPAESTYDSRRLRSRYEALEIESVRHR